ncbi:GNAT family N-acetyltransferase [uncultured Alistipes sp.]|uniref:GNAT family N-acetyltransferase n=1 Tax=uncultured Alistipes sp. TaxID=538949 RepID=UPI00260B887E|nr:GNAT family N-acetyltransferase [uncultured Alistipes sp.]
MKMIPLTPKVFLRELCREDAASIFSAIDADRGYLGRWLPFVQYTRTKEDSLRYIESVLDAAYREAVFTIREEGALIGLIGFKSTDPYARSTEIGYWLREAWQGRGIVTQAVDRLCRMAREELAMRRVTIKCATGNLPSNRIPQRLGFVLDHVERHAELLEDGHYTDANVYIREL